MIIEEEDYLEHIGILRKSGRYPWGSGANPLQRSKSFLDRLEALRSEGLSDTQIAEAWEMSTTELRQVNTIALNEQKAADIAMAQRLAEKGLSNRAIGERMGGRNESSVRSLLAPGKLDKINNLKAIVEMLRKEVAEKEFVDVGTGNEHTYGVSKDKLGVAFSNLRVA